MRSERSRRIRALLRRCAGGPTALRGRDPLRDYLVRMQLLVRDRGTYRTTDLGYGVLLALTRTP